MLFTSRVLAGALYVKYYSGIYLRNPQYLVAHIHFYRFYSLNLLGEGALTWYRDLWPKFGTNKLIIRTACYIYKYVVASGNTNIAVEYRR